jgi:hypothetical protein
MQNKDTFIQMAYSNKHTPILLKKKNEATYNQETSKNITSLTKTILHWFRVV